MVQPPSPIHSVICHIWPIQLLRHFSLRALRVIRGFNEPLFHHEGNEEHEEMILSGESSEKPRIYPNEVIVVQ